MQVFLQPQSETSTLSLHFLVMNGNLGNLKVSETIATLHFGCSCLCVCACVRSVITDNSKSCIWAALISLSLSYWISPLSETNDVDPELISCTGPLRPPRYLAVCSVASTVVRQIGTNKSQVYSFTGQMWCSQNRKVKHFSPSWFHINNRKLTA